jgi:hypothetical protein
LSAVLTRSDFVRAPLQAAARPEGFKEWYHFVVQRPGWRLLVNFSLTYEAFAGGSPRLTPRVIVIAHDQHWAGAIERFDESELDVSADLSILTVGSNRMTLLPNGYRVVLDLPGHQIRGEFELRSMSRPFCVNNQPVGDGRVSWLFVPRLRADGWMRIGNQHIQLSETVAYHDHNWGRFQWGGDFGWTWGTILPSEADDAWSLVFQQMTDRRRLHCYYQALWVWRHDEPAAIFPPATVQTHFDGLLGRAADCTLPPPMRLVLGGEASGVPQRIDIAATRADSALHARFQLQSYARLAQPSEVFLDRSVVLCEANGNAHVTGSVNGEHVDFVGAGVFELLYG